MKMDILDARRVIEMVAKQQGISADEVIKEIDLAIIEAMQDPDPLVRARWAFIPRSGDRPSALEFIAYMRGIVQCDI